MAVGEHRQQGARTRRRPLGAPLRAPSFDDMNVPSFDDVNATPSGVVNVTPSGAVNARSRSDVAALMTLGRQLHLTGRHADAASCYRRIIDAAPGHVAAWTDLAAALAAGGAAAAAAECCRQALRLAPANTDARNTLAMLLRRFGDPSTARACMRTLLALDPAHPALANMGMILLSAGDGAGAVAWGLRSVRLDPLRGEAWNALGNSLRARALYPAALVAWSHALAANPALADAHGNLAGLLRDMEYADQAERALRRALQINPQHAGLLNSLAHILQGRNRPAATRQACRNALALAPGFADAWCNIGLAEQQEGAPERAALLFARAVVLDSGHPLARFNHSLLALAKGDLAAGWAGYGARFAAGQAKPDRRFAIPQWRGEPLAGKRLFIWREQGVGDEFLFASCYADVIRAIGRTANRMTGGPGDLATDQGGGVVIECERRLTSLFARSFPDAVVRAEQRFEPGTVERPDCDFHIPAGALPGLLRRSAADFPPRSQWLFADPNRIATWERRLDDLAPGLRVGVAWRSRFNTLNRRGAYAPLSAWGPVLSVPGVRFVNLQHGPCGDEIAAAEQAFGAPIHAAADLDLRDDFENTAALIAGLDLVIAPAVSVAELAGGLGVPVWRFGARDWTQLGTGTRPWAPSMRMFQPLGGEGLEGALTCIGRELRRVAARCCEWTDGPASGISAAAGAPGGTGERRVR